MTSARDAGESLFGAVHDDLRCRLKIGKLDPEAVKVASFSALEGLSRLFEYTVVVATDPDLVAQMEKALGGDATFTIEREGAPERTVHGIVTEVLPDGAYIGERHARTTIVIEPRLANLRYSGGFRMFQNASVRDVAEALFKGKIDAEWRVRPVPPAREYRTQQDESDLDFLARLLSDEGVHFYFEHQRDKSLLVLTNSAKGFSDLDGGSTIDFRETQGALTSEHVRTIRRAQRVRTGALEHRDYDFRQPRLALIGRAETGSPQTDGNAKTRELRDYPGEFVDPGAEGTPRAQMRLEELRADAATFSGTASSLRLSAGRQFTLAGHRDDGFNRKMILTEVSFGATVEGAFWERSAGARNARTAPGLARFHAVPSDSPQRPPRRRKPAAHLRTARVVGPKEGDPFVDEFGRIKVQFMWDRDGKFDEHSSCWIRMATPSAHGDEGFWSPHKVGSEVLVDFLDGDVDRPVVIGAVYNGREKQPYKQPGQATRSTWKVRGIPGGAGYNEITFENSKGSEQIILHAQKDLNETILDAHSESIGSTQSSTIGTKQTIKVGTDQEIHVGANQTSTIGADQTTTIMANRTTSITADDSLTITGSRTKKVLVADTVLVGAARSLTAASEAVTVGTRTKTVATSETTHVGGSRSESVGGSESVSIRGNRTVGIHGAEALSVEKTISITSKDNLTIKVGDDASLTMSKSGEIHLVAGDASIVLKKSGDIVLKGKNVTVEGDSKVNVKAENVAVKGSSKVAIN